MEINDFGGCYTSTLLSRVLLKSSTIRSTIRGVTGDRYFRSKSSKLLAAPPPTCPNSRPAFPMNYYFLTHITHHSSLIKSTTLIGNGDIPATCIAPRRPTITTAPPFPFDAICYGVISSQRGSDTQARDVTVGSKCSCQDEDWQNTTATARMLFTTPL
eukprot:scaffold8457_cov146-Skeletonema_marinoi.AAC.3